ncbi:MAG: TlpA family protein disulfide reductase [Ilumatobacteraceae bacterium]
MRAASLLAVAALVVGGCGGDGGGDGVVERLPDVELAPLNGEGAALALADVSGPAVINLWATWCAPCRRELPAFQEVSAARPDVEFIGVDIGEDPVASQQFLTRLGVTFPQFRDPNAELTDALGVASLPVTLFVDAEQRVSPHVGPISSAELEEALARLG